jgi:hypothetical protein
MDAFVPFFLRRPDEGVPGNNLLGRLPVKSVTVRICPMAASRLDKPLAEGEAQLDFGPYIGGASVPSDHLPTGIKNKVKRSSTSLKPIIGESGIPAPHVFGSTSRTKNIK